MLSMAKLIGGRLERVECYVQYLDYPKNKALIARVRGYCQGMPSYGRNLLKGRSTHDFNEAIMLAWNQLREMCYSVEFVFEPLMNMSAVTWTDGHQPFATELKATSQVAAERSNQNATL